jgi:GH35 family endo-1,4-beta-xylanase
MKSVGILVAVALLLSGCATAYGPPTPEGRRIRNILADKYPEGNVYVGGTTGWNKRPRGSGVIVDREFGYVTPENDFKQSVIHPEPGVWDWAYADAWIKKCAEQKQIVRIHGPISPQCSKWVKDDNRTPEELKQNLIEYATALYRRYDKHPHVKWIDVVNETVLSNGKWNGSKKGNDKWECAWTRIGYDKEHPLKPPLYIKMAFEIAYKHAPNTKLIINQNGGMEKPMWQKVEALVLYLRAHGLRVDGIGWQAHIDTGWEKRSDNMDRLNALIDWAHSNELSFHVTEMNAWLKGKEKDFDAQAETFSAIMGALLEHRDRGVVTWNVWNISDADAWQAEKNMEGCLFDRQYSAKPGYYALQRLLENPPAMKRK